MAEDKGIPAYLRYIFGGTAGCGATLVVHPLDVLKNRLQLSGEGKAVKEHKTTFHALRSILRNEGVFSLYSGLTAGLLRQATYTTTRLGIYQYLFVKFSKDGKPPAYFQKALIGIAAGGTGAFVGTPSEVALIRMTADGRLPPAERRNYTNVVNALVRVVREEGTLTLWRGCSPTVVRAMVVNMAQLATYSQAKQMLLHSGYLRDNLFCQFLSSMLSGFATTVASLPVDIAKTRIQNMKPPLAGQPPLYTGTLVPNTFCLQ